METVETNVAQAPVALKRGARFTIRKVASQQTLGESLSQRRAALGRPVIDLARELNINASYLEALEQGAHDRLPGTVYALAFLKTYAAALGLDPVVAIKRYRSELKIAQHSRAETADQWRPVRRTHWRYFLVPARLARHAAIALVLVAALTYLGFKVEAIVQPPFLEVSSPADEVLTANPLLIVAGQTEVGASVLVNGQSVLTDPAGRFSTPLDLVSGVNLISVSARKNHRNETVVVRRVVLQAIDDN